MSDNTIILRPLKSDGSIPLEMLDDMISRIPAGYITTWPEIKKFLVQHYGEKAVDASRETFRTVLGDLVDEA